MKPVEIFIGPCSKYIDKQGWTTEIPIAALNEKGYQKVNEGDKIITKDEADQIQKYHTSSLEHEKQAVKAYIKALKKHYPYSPTVRKTINNVFKQLYNPNKNKKNSIIGITIPIK